MSDTHTYPFPICHAVPGEGEHEGKIVFVRWTRKTSFVLNSCVPEVLELWARCTGWESIEQICGSVSFDSMLARQLITGLFKQQLLVDASQLGVALHAIANNPTPFPRMLTASQVAAITTPDLGIQQGKVVCNLGAPGKTGPLFGLLRDRFSVRRFSGKGIDHDQLGRLLLQTYSTVLKPTASAGDLYPLRIYFMLAFDQAGLSAGLYQFDPSTHNVVYVGGLPERREREFAFNSDTLLGEAPLVVVIAASPDRQALKYGNRGVRFTYGEAGMATQNLVIGAAEMGMGTLVYGKFNDSPLADLFGMDPVISHPILVVGVGFVQPGQFDSAARTLKRLKENLPIGSSLVFGGSNIEPTGNYRVQAQLIHGAGNVFVGGGVAPSFDAAYLRAAAEAYERYAVASFDRVDMRCPADAIQERWIDPRQAAPMALWQQEVLGLSAFSPTEPWQWVRGEDWVTGKPVFVPFDMVGYSVQRRFNRLPCVHNCSSGVAVHTSRSEAARRGLLELLERDALMRYWLLQRVPSRIRIRALPKFLQARVAQLQAEGRSVDVLNFSDDGYGVAVIGVAIHGSAYPCFVLGMAASDRHWQEAVIKAFTEADQSHASPLAPQEAPLLSNVRSPKDHGDLYAHPSFAQKAIWLCRGEFGPVPPAEPLAKIVDTLSPVVVNLTRDGAPLVGVRVVCAKLVSIVFGHNAAPYTHPALGNAVKTQIDLPVPFA